MKGNVWGEMSGVRSCFLQSRKKQDLTPIISIVPRFPGLVVLFRQFLYILLRLHLYHNGFQALERRIGFYMGGIDGEVLTPDKTLSDALGNDLVEDLLEEGAFVKALMTVVREGGVIRDFILQGKTHEPAIPEVHLHLFTESSLRGNAVEIANKEHPQENFRVDGRTARMTVEVLHLLSNKAKIDIPVYQFQEVVLGDKIIDLHVVEHLLVAIFFA